MVSPEDASSGANGHPEIANEPGVRESEVSLLGKEAWYATVEEEIVQSEKDGSPLSVLFVDANYFKEVNLLLGQVVGDEVIEDMRGLVRYVSASFRTNRAEDEKNDVISLEAHSGVVELPDIEVVPGHIGGDELAVLCHTNEEGTKAIMARLRNRFDEYLVTRPELQKIGVGMAIGASTFEKGMTSQEFIRKAELAMHQDKLDQLPGLKRLQVNAIHAARVVLEGSGIRLIDAPKYWRKYPENPTEDQE